MRSAILTSYNAIESTDYKNLVVGMSTQHDAVVLNASIGMALQMKSNLCIFWFSQSRIRSLAFLITTYESSFLIMPLILRCDSLA